MRGVPHVELSATMRKISSRNSLLTHFLPARTRRRESHAQYRLNPARCQRTTVSGWTMINARFHAGQSRRKITQNSLSEVETCGRGCRCFNPTICWRRAKFSSSKSRRERKTRIKRTTTSLSRHSIESVSYGDRPCRCGSAKPLILMPIVNLGEPHPRQTAWSLLKEPEDARNYIAELCRRSPEIAACADLARQFVRMIRQRNAAAWPNWKDSAKSSLLASFAKHLCHDEVTLLAALQQPWSNGPVEGHVHRLKLTSAPCTAVPNSICSDCAS